MRVLALTKYGRKAASTRQRFVQYEDALKSAGISVHYAPLLDDAHIERLARGERSSTPYLALRYLRRLLTVLTSARYDILWVHCELFPYLPGLLEKTALLVRRPILFDYDDAIFHMYDVSGNPAVRWALGNKLAPLLRAASACGCGNAYLQRYAMRYCSNSVILPTVVDTSRYLPGAASEEGRPLTIGWIGTPSTWPYVRPILPMLRNLVDGRSVRFRVVGAGTAAESDRFDGVDLVDWSEESEIREVQAMDIGIMPLPDEPWARGKSGYKLIQYMACGLPVVASPVGVNSDIVLEGVSGFLAERPDQWTAALSKLLDSRELRAAMGSAGRSRAQASYSLAATAPRLTELMLSVAAGRGSSGSGRDA